MLKPFFKWDQYKSYQSTYIWYVFFCCPSSTSTALPYNIRALSNYPFDSLFDGLTRSVRSPWTLPHTDTGCIRNKPETMMATKQPANQRRDLGAVWEDSHSNNKCALNSLQSKAINNKLVAGSGGPIPIPHVDVQFRLHRLELINHYCIMTIKYNTISHSIKYNLCELLIWLIWTGWWVLDQLRAAPLRGRSGHCWWSLLRSADPGQNSWCLNSWFRYTLKRWLKYEIGFESVPWG